VRAHVARPLLNASVATAAVVTVLAPSPTAWARGGYHHEAAAAPPCGASAGGLPDPAQTKRCLAERYKPPKPGPTTSSPAQPDHAPAGAYAPPAMKS
jgi:hypothetical protein